MGRMTKYLHQTCSIETAVRDSSDQVVSDLYGASTFNKALTVRCRREHITKDVLTANGSVVKSATRYYLDESVNVRIGDKIDGLPVYQVSDFIDERGISEGVECYV